MDAMPSIRSSRSFRHILLSAVLTISGLATARAQNIQVYATAAPTHLNHLYTVTGGATPVASLSGNWFIGADAGVTFNFYHSPAVILGLDFRGGPEIGTPGLGSALVGFRIAGSNPVFHLKPYFQLSTGWMEQRHQTGSGAFTITDAETYIPFQIFGGVDYPVNKRIDIRVVEVGVGVTHILAPDGIETPSKPDMFTLKSGVVVNF
jgi:hypothetical protein